MPIEQLLNAFALMKSSIIHHNDAFGFKAWDQRELAPIVKYGAVNVLLKVIKRKQHLFIESTNDIRTLFCLPVVAINTRFTYRSIAVRSDGFNLKAAFIHINNRIALLLKAIKPTVILSSFY